MAKAKQSAEAEKQWPGTAIWPLAKIKPYERNARTHPENQIDLLAKLIERFGPDQPIVVDETGVILKGHGRLEAAARAKLTEFPVFIHAGLSDADKAAIRIADNQVALLSGWNQDLLRAEMDDLAMAEFDMPLLGFSEDDLRALSVGVVPLDEMPTLPSGERSEYQQMTFTVHESQAPDVLKAVEAARAELGEDDKQVNKNRNGSALAVICRAYLKAANGGA